MEDINLLFTLPKLNILQLHLKRTVIVKKAMHSGANFDKNQKAFRFSYFPQTLGILSNFITFFCSRNLKMGLERYFHRNSLHKLCLFYLFLQRCKEFKDSCVCIIMIDIKILEIGLVNHGEICGIFKAIKNHKNVNNLTGPRMFDLSKSEDSLAKYI